VRRSIPLLQPAFTGSYRNPSVKSAMTAVEIAAVSRCATVSMCLASILTVDGWRVGPARCGAHHDPWLAGLAVKARPTAYCSQPPTAWVLPYDVLTSAASSPVPGTSGGWGWLWRSSRCLLQPSLLQPRSTCDHHPCQRALASAASDADPGCKRVSGLSGRQRGGYGVVLRSCGALN
jgi:hypothetical protein